MFHNLVALLGLSGVICRAADYPTIAARLVGVNAVHDDQLDDEVGQVIQNIHRTLPAFANWNDLDFTRFQENFVNLLRRIRNEGIDAVEDAPELSEEMMVDGVTYETITRNSTPVIFGQGRIYDRTTAIRLRRGPNGRVMDPWTNQESTINNATGWVECDLLAAVLRAAPATPRVVGAAAGPAAPRTPEAQGGLQAAAPADEVEGEQQEHQAQAREETQAAAEAQEGTQEAAQPAEEPVGRPVHPARAQPTRTAATDSSEESQGTALTAAFALGAAAVVAALG